MNVNMKKYEQTLKKIQLWNEEYKNIKYGWERNYENIKICKGTLINIFKEMKGSYEVTNIEDPGITIKLEYKLKTINKNFVKKYYNSYTRRYET